MHPIYHSRAIIITSRPSGEADKLFWLFTQKFGLVVALATGVRKSSAKLKGQLIDYCLVEVDLVLGKDIWRIVSASEVLNPIKLNPRSLFNRSYVRALATLERFLVGEEENLALFEHIKEVANFLITQEALENQGNNIMIKNYDTMAIWRIFEFLGYVDTQIWGLDFAQKPFQEAVLTLEETQQKKLIKIINQTITETHL